MATTAQPPRRKEITFGKKLIHIYPDLAPKLLTPAHQPYSYGDSDSYDLIADFSLGRTTQPYYYSIQRTIHIVYAI